MKCNEFKPVVGYDGYYEVNRCGIVKSVKREFLYNPNKKNLNRMIKKTVNPKIRKYKINKHTGYKFINLNKDGASKNETVHSMVAKAWIGVIRDGYCVNHIDGDKLSNCINNLEIISRADNNRHAFRTGLISAMPVLYKGVKYYSKAEMEKSIKNIRKKTKKINK